MKMTTAVACVVLALPITHAFVARSPPSATTGGIRHDSTQPARVVGASTIDWEVDKDPSANFCRDGKLLPQFYLLGAPKCATTSFSMELGRFGHVREAPKLWSPKEWHFWERWVTDADAEKATSKWMERLGDCPKEDRLVLGDYSINNLAAVPLPKGMTLTACSCEQNEVGQGGDVPRLLKAAYGKKDSKNVTLMMMLREPMARMQSSWYHAKSENFSTYWGYQDCCTDSFSSALELIAGTVDNGYYGPGMAGTGSVWASMYGWQMQEWMKHWDPTQMIIVPYKAYTGGGKAKLCNELSKRMRAPMDCSVEANFMENKHAHDALAEEVSSTLSNRFTAILEEDKKRLLQALQKAHAHGARLENYKGNAWDWQAMKTWLEENW